MSDTDSSTNHLAGRLLGYDLGFAMTRYGQMFYVADDEVIGRSLRKYGEWAEQEIHLLSELMKDPEMIVDVGANIGTHTLAFSARFPQTRVLAVEPQPLAYAILSANVISNHRQNIELTNFGCDAKSNTKFIAANPTDGDHNIGAVSFASDHDNETGRHPISFQTLDHLVNNRKVDLIKIDVEGMESMVIEGGMQTIIQSRPIIYFEVLDLDALQRTKMMLQAFDYDLRWLETSAYNENNFNSDPENIWWLGETGVIALPIEHEHPLAAELPAVTGTETELPRRKYAKYAESEDDDQTAKSQTDPEEPKPETAPHEANSELES